MARTTTCIFDAYGTLFDVAASARAAAREPGRDALAGCWQDLATDWRLKQLHYSWLRTITGEHTSFWQVTCDALDWTLERHGLASDAELRDRLLALYRTLDAYPEVAQTLADLRARGLTCAILSNGTPDMLAAAVDSAGLRDHLDAVLSVESVGIFKPSSRVYDMVEGHFGCTRDAVLFVSSNGWDIAGASGYGFATAWINRTNDPVDRLPHRPGHILTDLSTIPDLIA